MRTKIIVLFTALALALSVGTGSALAKKSGEAAVHGLTTVLSAIPSGHEAATENVSLNF